MARRDSMTFAFRSQGDADRLDRVLARQMPELSRSAARRLIAAGGVYLNGRRCRIASRQVRRGDEIVLSSAATHEPSAALPILYQDAWLAAVDKPPGMPAAPTRQAAAGSALDELQRQLREGEGRPVRLWVVHRLDAATSGVLVFGKSSSAAARLSRGFRDQRVEKTYVAWVHGIVGAEGGRIELAVGRAGSRATITPSGKHACTEWSVLQRDEAGTRTLLELRPLTGRMHQLRVHLRAFGHPVVGDRLYGGPVAPRLMLHAASLQLPHPHDGRIIRIEAPLPAELASEKSISSADGAPLRRGFEGQADGRR